NDSRSENANISKKDILEILPEISANDDSVVDQLKQYTPIYKVNDVISEDLTIISLKNDQSHVILENLE
ncbi:13199_t:CDS:2, partial [Ambispora leptoticha]